MLRFKNTVIRYLTPHILNLKLQVTPGAFVSTTRTSSLVVSAAVDKTGYRCEVTLGDSTASVSTTLYTGGTLLDLGVREG